ncbi:heparan sulfate 2-O-sulfotransferase pipe [Neocloeon triangulifer]|uniref:heparan sulfate 2-O-sulfotransferase pipe n=1 Tax=Neocloeon triangulifer TaxID=2078957 RepID=UPI00286F4FBD|nr:heparan sulfate 2-O-sulfotransferase pipe [Neocloeon triangulifer]
MRGSVEQLIKNGKRFYVPRRPSELLALLALSTTLFLFLHTRDLQVKLKEMETRATGESAASSSRGIASSLAESAVNTVVITSGGDPTSSSSSSKIMLAALAGTLPQGVVTEEIDVTALNNTARAKKDIIFFNRVPKVGSQTIMELIRRLSHRNGFNFHRDKVQRVESIRLAPRDESYLAQVVSNYEPPSVYVKHVCFTNFTKYGYPEPIYINLVRDPVERVISWYYYIRAPWYYVERKQVFPDLPLPDPNWLKKDFETCVLRGDRECRFIEGETREGIGDHRRQTLFFCGHGEECTPFNTEGALQRAKAAVERHYAVVGVLEEFNKTLSVFEHYIPRFFSGASQVYWDSAHSLSKINKNLYKPTVSEEIKNLVRQNFTRETEFYQFCRQRLHKQYVALHGLGLISN